MADQKINKKDEAQSEQFKKQDTKQEISDRVKELRDQFDPQLEGDDVDPMLIERVNQIFNDAIAAIPPDPQEPKFQRATILTTVTRIKEQLEAALNSTNTKKEVADKFKSPLQGAVDKAKQEDEEKKTAQPGGPSQSQEQTRFKEQSEMAERQNKQGDQPQPHR